MRPSSLLLRSLPPRSFALGTAHSPLQVERQLRDRRVVLLLRAVPARRVGLAQLLVHCASAADRASRQGAVSDRHNRYSPPRFATRRSVCSCGSHHALALGTGKLLDAVVVAVADEDVPAPIHGDATGIVELPVPAAHATPLAEEAAAVRELLNAIVAGVCDKDVRARIGGDAEGKVELPVPAAQAAPLGEEGPGVRELLDAMVVAVADEDVPARIHGEDKGVVDLPAVELPVPAARAAPLRDELTAERDGGRGAGSRGGRRVRAGGCRACSRGGGGRGRRRTRGRARRARGGRRAVGGARARRRAVAVDVPAMTVDVHLGGGA